MKIKVSNPKFPLIFVLSLFLGVLLLSPSSTMAQSLNWSYQTGDLVYSSPAVSSDGTIYIGSVDSYLYALNLDGTLKWRYKTGADIYSSPAISFDGTIYIGSADTYLYALNPDGTLKWRYRTGGDVFSSPAIGSDGTIYVGSRDNNLYALNSDGTLKWKFQTGGFVDSSPAIDTDGTIYVGSYDDYLYALNPDGTLKWRYRTGEDVFSSPAISSDGTIYVGSWDKHIYAINSDGTLKWKFQTGDFVDSSAAIDTDGTIYVGSYDGYLYALNPDGTLKWKFNTGNFVGSSPAIGSVSSTGSNGIALFNEGNDKVIYVGSGYKFFAVYPDGTVKWVFSIDSPFGFLDCSATIASGSVIFACSGGLVYAVDSQGRALARSDWPKIFKNLENTAMAGVGVALPTLTLSGGSVWSGCPDEVLGQEVTILSFSLSADETDSWQMDSFRFETWAGSNAYRHIEEVKLYKVDKGSRQLLARSTYFGDVEPIALIPESQLFVFPGETINLELVYKFKGIECPFGQDFRVLTHPGLIYAIPFLSEHGLKLGPEIEGVVSIGCVKNTTTNKAFAKIQDAIDDEETKDGHTIIVCPGTYVENVRVTKNGLTIRSRDGRDSTIVQAQNPDDDVFIIFGNNTTIDGFTIKSGDVGIYIAGDIGTVIVNNSVADNAKGISFWYCYSLNLIEGNNIIGNRGDGVAINSSFGIKIVKNTIAGNADNGIELVDCLSPSDSRILIKGNLIQGNSSHGVYFWRSINNIVISNIILGNSTGIGSSLSYSDGYPNDITSNFIQNGGGSQTGIHLDGSNPEIIGNTISDDAGDGIKCENGANPVIRKNNITNNTGFGLNNIDISVNIDAQENWWGDASGPGGAGPGTGDEVSEYVNFSNWRTAPVALTVTSGWDVHGAKGTEVTATFYVANLSDANDTYNINVSDTLGWPIDPITLTETIIAGQSKEILINVSIPLDALNGTEDEIILIATSTSDPTVTDSATLKVTVGEIWMIIDDFSVGAPPLTVTDNEGVFPLKDGMTVQSPMILGGEFDAVINLVGAELGDGASVEIRAGSLHYTQDASCTAVLIFHYDGNDGSWEQVHASTGLGGGIDITNGGTYDRIRVTFLNNVSPFVMAVILFTDQANSSEAKITVPVSADPFTVEYLFEGLVHQGNGADLTNVRTILFLAGSGGGMTGLMDFEIDGIWAIPVDETPPPPVAALSNSWGFDTSYLLPRWWP